MSKILISVKVVFFLLYTAGVTGVANILNILTEGNPPVIFYYFAMSTICSIPFSVIFIKDFRVWILKGHEYYDFKKSDDKKIEYIRNDVKGLLATLLSFLCIMFLGIGYLNQIFYNIEFLNFDKCLLLAGAAGFQGVNAFLNKNKS